MKNILRGVVVLFAVLTAAPVWAQTVSTTYIDENGTSHTVTAKVLTDTTGTFTSDTWYVVNSNVVRNSTIGYEGNIKLIIADGKTLDISGCLGVNGTTSISIYGQTHGTGKLSVNNGNFAIRASGSINITGCIVEATSDNNHAVICGIGGSTGNININGGQVTALGGVGKGLSATGTITLGYRKKTDYISAKGFRGTVNIKSGQTLYNGATAYSGNDVGLTGSATLRPFSSNDLSINNTGTEYTIYSATGWNLFCDFLNDNDTYNRFSGKTVRLGANITVTRMAGSDYHDFCGIFDGQGHTITLDGNTTNGCYALFRNVSTGRANSTDTEDTPSGKYFKLGDDITYPYTTAWNDATSTENNYEAIGCALAQNDLRRFYGHFDGDNHTISGIRIYKKGEDEHSNEYPDKYQGIFGLLYNASVCNITLADTRITAEYYTGGIAGSNFAETGHIGSISNCHVAANILIHTDQNGIQWHGGIVGRNANCQIDHCTSAATLTIADGVTNCSQYGAIAGYNSGYMTYNLAIGAVIPAISQHGAICGYHSLSQFIEKNYYYNCTVAGMKNVTGKGYCNCTNETGADIDINDGAVSIHLLTLGDNVTTSTPFTFTHNETGYYKHTATVELGCTLDVPNGYSVVYTATTADGTDVTATAINGSTLTMPAADVTVTANLCYILNIPAGTWQAISTPMHDEGGDYESIANVDGLTDGSYDFFRYDEGTSTWENQKIYSDFALEIGNGYLYRCSEAKTLTYHGEPNMAASYSVALSASGNSDLNGFNLVGNPYNYGITLEIPFYSINADGSWTAHNANETIAMGQAVIVHTNQDVDLIFEAAGKRAYLSNPAAKGPLPALPAMLNFENRNSIFEIQNSESLSTLFAYQNGDQLVITATGTLQAFDVMGRLLFSREVPGSKCEIPTLNFPSAGVYVLRLDGKSQKIVIN